MEDKANRIRLVNFNAPQHLLSNFDHIVRFKSTSRTSTLLGLMEQYVRDEVDQIEKDNRLNHLISEMDERSRRSLGKRIKDTVKQVLNEDTSPPSMMWHTHDTW